MFDLLAKNFKLIFVWGVLLAVISAAISLLFPWKYSAQSQVLIISRDRSGVDPYTQAKSAERIGDNLTQVMRTSDFMQKVMDTPNATFDKARWQNLTARKQRQLWEKDVVGEMQYGSSLMRITVYSTKDDVVALANAVTDAVATRGWEYIGGDVALKIVSAPLISPWIAKPNIILNAMIGFVAGLILSSAWVIKYKRHLFGL
jgi:capsular polysaccharide biosynthesis protein